MNILTTIGRWKEWPIFSPFSPIADRKKELAIDPWDIRGPFLRVSVLGSDHIDPQDIRDPSITLSSFMSMPQSSSTQLFGKNGVLINFFRNPDSFWDWVMSMGLILHTKYKLRMVPAIRKLSFLRQGRRLPISQQYLPHQGRRDDES